jgi:hypothetical protein
MFSRLLRAFGSSASKTKSAQPAASTVKVPSTVAPRQLSSSPQRLADGTLEYASSCVVSSYILSRFVKELWSTQLGSMSSQSHHYIPRRNMRDNRLGCDVNLSYLTCTSRGQLQQKILHPPSVFAVLYQISRVQVELARLLIFCQCRRTRAK